MPRPASRPQQPAQRRPRIEKACSFCRIAKQRCEPTEYGTNDRPCRRCVSQKLNCNLPRVARSQSPSSGLGAQGSGPIQHPIAPHPAGGATEELTLGSASGTNVQYTLPESESVQVPMRRWSPLMMHSEEQQDSSTTTTLTPGQTPFQTPSFVPAAPGMEGCQQSFPNFAQGSNNPESGYYQDYYGPATYATQGASDGESNLGYTLEDQPDDGGASVNEQNDSLSPAGEF